MSSCSFRCNNPGNIRFGKFAQNHGAIDADGYAKFPTAIEGTAALLEILSGGMYRNLDLVRVFQRFAPTGDNNNPDAYAHFVSARSGVPLDVMLADLDPFQVLKILEAITAYEGWKS